MIRKFVHAFVLGSAPLWALGGAAHAQGVPGVNTTAILASCEIATTDCQLLVQQALANLQAAGLSDAEYASAIASLAATVLQAAQGSPNQSGLYSSILRDIANVARDPGQANSIVNVADLVEDGNANDVSVEVFSASPA